MLARYLGFIRSLVIGVVYGSMTCIVVLVAMKLALGSLLVLNFVLGFGFYPRRLISVSLLGILHHC